jgi:hypothetical protein
MGSGGGGATMSPTLGAALRSIAGTFTGTVDGATSAGVAGTFGCTAGRGCAGRGRGGCARFGSAAAFGGDFTGGNGSGAT